MVKKSKFIKKIYRILVKNCWISRIKPRKYKWIRSIWNYLIDEKTYKWSLNA